MANYYYSDGTINIPNVTGNVVITVKAVKSAEPFVNKMVVRSSGMNRRISGTTLYTIDTASNGVFICDPISVDLTKPCVVKFKNFASTMGSIIHESGPAYGNSKVALLNASSNVLAVWYIGKSNQRQHWYCPVKGDNCEGDLSSIFETEPAAGTIPSASDVAYVIFSPAINNDRIAITMDDLSGLEIQMYED